MSTQQRQRMFSSPTVTGKNCEQRSRNSTLVERNVSVCFSSPTVTGEKLR